MTSSVDLANILRSVAAVARNPPQSIAELQKVEVLHTTLCELISIYQQKTCDPQRRLQCLRLFNTLSEDLSLPFRFNLGDLLCDTGKGKYLQLLHQLSLFMDNKAYFELGQQLLMRAEKLKDHHSSLVQNLNKKEQLLASKLAVQANSLAKVEKLKKEAHAVTHNRKEAVGSLEVQKKSRDDLRQFNTNAEKEVNELQLRIEVLSVELTSLRERSMKNPESVPGMVSELRSQMYDVEAEIHNLFERRAALAQEVHLFQDYENLLEQLHNEVNRTYSLMEQVSTSQKKEQQLTESLSAEETNLKRFNEKKYAIMKKFADQSNLRLRSKLVLEKRKKGHKADLEKAEQQCESVAKELESVKQCEKHFAQLIGETERQIDHLKSELDKRNVKLDAAKTVRSKFEQISNLST